MPSLRPCRLRNTTGIAAILGLAPVLALSLSPPAAAQSPEPTHHRPAHVAAPAPHHRSPQIHAAPRQAHLQPHAPPPPPPKPVPVVVPPPVPPPLPKGTNTGLPLPRYAALRADAVNMRSGPGTRYPIQWVYRRRDLPVRIEREFDVWRLVEDSDGVKGWVQGATLVGTRSFVILTPSGTPSGEAGDTEPAAVPVPTAAAPGGAANATLQLPSGTQMLRAAAQPDAPVVAILKPGVIGRLRLCAPGSGWCRVSIRDYAGWLPRTAFWGLLPDETIQAP